MEHAELTCECPDRASWADPLNHCDNSFVELYFNPVTCETTARCCDCPTRGLVSLGGTINFPLGSDTVGYRAVFEMMQPRLAEQGLEPRYQWLRFAEIYQSNARVQDVVFNLNLLMRSR